MSARASPALRASLTISTSGCDTSNRRNSARQALVVHDEGFHTGMEIRSRFRLILSGVEPRDDGFRFRFPFSLAHASMAQTDCSISLVAVG